MKSKTFEKSRAVKIIKETIKDLDLDLRGLSVLTEVGSGPFIYNPIIPALGGAEKIMVWVKDSVYGKAVDIIDECRAILSDLNIKSSIYFRNNSRPIEDVQAADIVTNSAMLRPIDASFISNMKSDAVISLMFEAWELRDTDVDLKACKNKGIKIGGTWENHPKINVFNYTSILAVKMILDADIEIYKSNIFIWSSDDFGLKAKESLSALGANKIFCNTSVTEFYQNLRDLDSLYICDYHEKRKYFGIDGIFDLNEIVKVNPELTIIHLYGDVDIDLVNKAKIKITPQKKGHPQIMTHTLSYVGLTPLLKLQTAGFKVGEGLYKNSQNDLIQKL